MGTTRREAQGSLRFKGSESRAEMGHALRMASESMQRGLEGIDKQREKRPTKKILHICSDPRTWDLL